MPEQETPTLDTRIHGHQGTGLFRQPVDNDKKPTDILPAPFF
jgi:hypothetical protein